MQFLALWEFQINKQNEYEEQMILSKQISPSNSKKRWKSFFSYAEKVFLFQEVPDIKSNGIIFAMVITRRNCNVVNFALNSPDKQKKYGNVILSFVGLSFSLWKQELRKFSQEKKI